MLKLFYLNNEQYKIKNQRGAEMVEYAIVLACVVAVGIFYYAHGSGGTNVHRLPWIMGEVWEKISNLATSMVN